MTYQEFKTACDKLKDFLREQDRLEDVIKIIAPDSTAVVEFGSYFIDAYVNLMAIALGDEYDWVTWFVFENEFGKDKKEISELIGGKEKKWKITNEKTFYNFITKR